MQDRRPVENQNSTISGVSRQRLHHRRPVRVLRWHAQQQLRLRGVRAVQSFKKRHLIPLLRRPTIDRRSSQGTESHADTVLERTGKVAFAVAHLSLVEPNFSNPSHQSSHPEAKSLYFPDICRVVQRLVADDVLGSLPGVIALLTRVCRLIGGWEE